MELEIYRVDNAYKKRVWETFRKYHYLNTDLHQAAEQWVGILNGQVVCHTGVIQFPLRKGWKRIHRLVVLPDYQGVGIGTHFLNAVSEKYHADGWEMNLTTTTPSLVHALVKDKKWILRRQGRVSSSMSDFQSRYNMKSGHFDKSQSNHRITYSFFYKGEKAS